jgi:hypothetical protein
MITELNDLLNRFHLSEQSSKEFKDSLNKEVSKNVQIRENAENQKKKNLMN